MLGRWRVQPFSAGVSAVSARASRADASAVHSICTSLALVLAGCESAARGPGTELHADAGGAGHLEPSRRPPARYWHTLAFAATLSISDDCDFWAGYFRDGGTVRELVSR